MTRAPKTSIAITGMGVVTPAGSTVDDFWTRCWPGGPWPHRSRPMWT